MITTVEMTDVEKTTRDLVGQVTDGQKAAWLPAGASTARFGNPACANRPDCHLGSLHKLARRTVRVVVH